MESNPSYKKYVETNTFVARFYKHMLLNTVEGEKAYDYLISRGFTRETMESNDIGWSQSGDLVAKMLEAHGHKLNEVESFGLLKYHEKSGSYKDFFNSRIIFPIRNVDGEIVGFSGRTLPGNGHPAKYMNTADTIYFEKGDHLYNLDFAKDRIKEKNVAYVFEGYLDSITATQHGLTNVVSAMGIYLTDEQIEQLKRVTDRVVVCLDGDEAGFKSAMSNGKKLMDSGLEVRFGMIPDGLDPHDFITSNGVHTFISKVISKAKNYTSFCKEYSKLSKDLSIEVDGLTYVNDVFSGFQGSSDADQMAVFNELMTELNMPIDLINEAIHKEFNK